MVWALSLSTMKLISHSQLFRGEQAISRFVWHITSTHSSSQDFATSKGSGLHEFLRSLHPDHG